MYNVEIKYVEDKSETYHKLTFPYIPAKGSCIDFSEKMLTEFCERMIQNGAKGNADELEMENIGYLPDAKWVICTQYVPETNVTEIHLNYGN